MEKLFEAVMPKIKKAIEDRGTMRSVSLHLDLNPSTVSRWFAEGRSPDFRALTVIFEYLGIRIVFPDEPVNGDAALLAENKELHGKVEELTKELKELEKEIEAHKEYKAKWEGHIEALQAAASAKERTRIQEAELEKFSAPPLEHYSEEAHA